MKRNIILLLFILAITTIGCANENAMDLENREAQPIASGDKNHSEFLSSEQTTISSFEFPHTKPVKVQEAKYEFEVDSEQIHSSQLYDLKNIDIDNIRNQLREQIRSRQPVGSPTDTEQQQRPEQPQTPEPEQPQPQAPEPEASPEQPQAPQPGPEPEQTDEPEQNQKTDQQTNGIGQEEQRVIELTNQHRRDAGLSDLQADSELSAVARKKSVDMNENNYFSHTSPTYGSPFDMMRDHGVEYNAAGENIAQGQQSPEQAVQGWMDSQGHRENILNGNFTHIGVGYDENGHHWTQMFISR